MFDERCDCLGLKDVDTGLAIFVDWQRTNVIFIEAKEFCHISKVEAFLSSCKGTTGFAAGRMERNPYLLFGLPINANVVDESNDIVARLVSMIVPCMITFNSEDETICEMNFSKFGRTKVNT